MNGCDLLIVGAGPTGLVLALWLAKLGVRVRIRAMLKKPEVIQPGCCHPIERCTIVRRRSDAEETTRGKETKMASKPFATGHCLCGAVSFTIHAEPIGTGQCHCKDCQRASGTGHMSIARFRKDDVAIGGQTASYASTADSGNINTRYFCPKCGSRLFGENSGVPGVINIAVGCVNDNDWFVPGRVVYAKDRPRWDVTSTDVPNFDRMPT